MIIIQDVLQYDKRGEKHVGTSQSYATIHIIINCLCVLNSDRLTMKTDVQIQLKVERILKPFSHSLRLDPICNLFARATTDIAHVVYCVAYDYRVKFRRNVEKPRAGRKGTLARPSKKKKYTEGRFNFRLVRTRL